MSDFERIFVYDLETDNLITETENGDEKYPAILEICIIDYFTDEVMYNDFVFSDEPIDEFITTINNINNDMIKDSPTVDQTRDKLFNLFKEMKNIAVVAHNGNNFDHKIMNHYKLFPKHLNVTYLDSKVILPTLPNMENLHSYRLFNVYENLFGSKINNIHSAKGDTLALIKILKKLSWKIR